MRVLPKAVLLGRPNVGKSTLFNRLIRSNRAITHDRPGVTRDRMEGTVRRRGEEDFMLVDTGGVTMDSHARVQEGPEGIRGFEAQILEQARQALAESDLLCLVVDGRDGLTPLDRHLADFLRKAGKALLVAVNKVDGPELQDILLAEFHSLGLPLLPCSAAHGFNMTALEEKLRDYLFPPKAPLSLDELTEAEAALLQGATRRQKKRLLEDLLKERQAPRAGTEAGEAAWQSGQIGQTGEVEPARPGPAGAAGGVEAAGAAGGPDEAEAAFTGIDGQRYEASALYAEVRDAGDMDPGEQGAGTGSGDAWSDPDPDGGPLRLALLGRPNAGKSSLVNSLCGKERMIVSEVAGTTRDSVDVRALIDGEDVTFVDTAGVRRRAKITDTVERYSVNSSIKSSTKAHVTLLVLDASEGLTQQDKRLIELLNGRKTPFMLLVNKSDLMEPGQRNAAQKMYKEALAFCRHVPLLFVSAKNRHNLKKIVPLAREIRRECGLRVPTGQLNRAMAGVLEAHQPPLVRRVRARFFYLTQAESRPPTFVFFVNDAERILPSYARYLEKSLRGLFGIKHAPMRVNFRSSHQKKKKG
ncbi:ribosome biogenesis GTPase Der [Desulfovibrio sp. OttesenSCG-928-G11]|nr:ribosome biogenesis GTPase Der [Desulfovibrio sp. OttesenSCG-928-G11]